MTPAKKSRTSQTHEESGTHKQEIRGVAARLHQARCEKGEDVNALSDWLAAQRVILQHRTQGGAQALRTFSASWGMARVLLIGRIPSIGFPRRVDRQMPQTRRHGALFFPSRNPRFIAGISSVPFDNPDPGLHSRQSPAAVAALISPSQPRQRRAYSPSSTSSALGRALVRRSSSCPPALDGSCGDEMPASTRRR